MDEVPGDPIQEAFDSLVRKMLTYKPMRFRQVR
jgi:hypothetical protein